MGSCLLFWFFVQWCVVLIKWHHSCFVWILWAAGKFLVKTVHPGKKAWYSGSGLHSPWHRAGNLVRARKDLSYAGLRGALTDWGCFSLDVALCLDTSALPEAWTFYSSLQQTLGFPHMLLSSWMTYSGINGNCSSCVRWVPHNRLRKILNRNIDLL